MDGSWTIMKAEHQRTDAFKLWCWRRLLRVPWTARRSNQSILKEINPEYSLEGEAEFQYFGHLIWRADSLEKLWYWKRLRAREEGVGREWDVWWHHQLNEHEFEQIQGDSEGQGSLVCCSPWGCKESDMTDWLNNNVSPMTILCIEPFIFQRRFGMGKSSYSRREIEWQCNRQERD